MKALIDTHVFLWAITTPEKLSQTALQIIESKANDLFLSPVSC
jgi:PIN domain nuclease of toxin-antitoxin system